MNLSLFRPGRRLPLLVILVAGVVAGLLGLGLAQDSSAPSRIADSPIFCPVCGARNKAGSRFCMKDGAQLPTLDPARYSRSFVRAPETLSAEEIQSAVQQAARSVVRIRVKVNASLRYPETDEDEDGYLEVIKDEEKFVGSGFVIDADGSVVTNAHVATPDGMAGEITVDTTEGRSFPAKLTGVDRRAIWRC
jgi:S1-C subfamily serine protease